MNEKQSLFPFVAITVIFAILFCAVGFFAAKEIYQPKEQVGSVSITNAYQATSTVAMSNTRYKAAIFTQLIKAATYDSVTFGSLTVVSTTPHTMRFYNATSTAAMTNGDGKLIMTISSTTPIGNYIFDMIVDKGLVAQIEPGFGGEYIITYR